MKYFSWLLFFIFILGCQINSNNKPVLRKDIKDIEGVWGLTNYLDTIILHKQIAKHRTQFPAWFGVLVEIKKDTIRSFGSLKQVTGLLEIESDTLFKYLKTESGKWILLKNGTSLILKQSLNQENSDTLIYTLRKRDDLKYMTKNLKYDNKNYDNVNKIGNHLTNYFNKNIISGIYTLPKTKSTVNFRAEGKVEGFKDYTHFELRNYFGTYHPFRNLDVITMINKELKKEELYNWIIDGNKLTLTNLVRDSLDVSEKFSLGNKRITLIKDH